ncbi:MAG: GNAT family N-acetyltransferase [Verrucomicrobiota bacterium]
MSIIRRINIGEGMLYRAVRLAALGESPDAFSSKLADAILRTEESWHTQADQGARGSDRAIFLAIDEDPTGLAALYRDERFDHTTELIQMWVCPECRSCGLSQELLSSAAGWARTNGYRTIRAEVMPNNHRALRFYERCGFRRDEEAAPNPEAGIILRYDVEPAAARP